MALIELGLATKAAAGSLQQEFTIYRQKLLIEEYLQQKFKESKESFSGAQKSPEDEIAHDGGLKEAQLKGYAGLDVTIVITFETLINKFEKATAQSATDYIDFWSHLDSNLIDLNVIDKLGVKIIERSKIVTDLWAELTSINPRYPAALYLYGNYLDQIKNDFEQGKEMKMQYINVKKLKQTDANLTQYDMMFSEDTAIVVMNGSREQQGKIMKTNEGIQKLFGYSMFEVQGHDVSILMPPIIAGRHQSFMETYFRTGKERIINSALDAFAAYRTGTIFSAYIVVKPVPTIGQEIQYIGMLKPGNRDFEYILTDENGNIDAVSDGIIQLLKLPVSFFKEHSVPIQIIVPELCEVQRHKNPSTQQFETVTHFDVWIGQRELRFIIPKNFSNAGGRSGGHFGNQVVQQLSNKEENNDV